MQAILVLYVVLMLRDVKHQKIVRENNKKKKKIERKTKIVKEIDRW